MIKKHWPNLLLLLILILITYGNSFNNAFLSDDIAEIVQNPNIGNFDNLATRPFGFIRLFFYWLAFNLGGLNSVVFRSINIFLHLGTVFVIYALFNHLYSKRIALLTALIFAVHPGISEAVVWISGGSYPQYAFFFLLSFLFYILSAAKNSSSAYILAAKKKFYYLLSIIFYLLSLMSHPQMPTSLFLIFPLWELTQGNLKKNWAKVIPFFLLALTYLFMSVSFIPQRENTLQSMHYQQRGIDNPLVQIPAALSSYFELTFFPKILTLYHSELAFGLVQFILRALVTVLFFALLLFSFKKNKQIFFWASFFLIALAPTLTPLRLNWIVAERYLYLPILGLITIVVLGIDKLVQKEKFKQTVYVLFAAVIIILMSRTFIRNIDWDNENNLWIATGKTSPSSPNTHNNLGDVYGRLGDKQAALREFQTAIALQPNYGDAYHNLANTYTELGQPDKALENYQNALKYNPNLWQSYQNIAAIYFQQKQFDLALENIQKAINTYPANINLRLAQGVILLNAGQKDKAKEVFNLILSVSPNNPTALQGLSEASK